MKQYNPETHFLITQAEWDEQERIRDALGAEVELLATELGHYKRVINGQIPDHAMGRHDASRVTGCPFCDSTMAAEQADRLRAELAKAEEELHVLRNSESLADIELKRLSDAICEALPDAEGRAPYDRFRTFKSDHDWYREAFDKAVEQRNAAERIAETYRAVVEAAKAYRHASRALESFDGRAGTDGLGVLADEFRDARLALAAAVDALTAAEQSTPDDAHPERRCHRCGGPNAPWAAPSPLWNEVMRGGDINNSDLENWHGIICPTCFMMLAEQSGIAELWRLYPERVHRPLQTVTPSGRVWNEKTWKFDQPRLTAMPADEAEEQTASGDPWAVNDVYTVDCPTCGRMASAYCVNFQGREVYPAHAARYQRLTAPMDVPFAASGAGQAGGEEA